jgi:signal peptidase I
MNFRESEVRPKNEIDPHIFPQGAPWNKDWYGPIRVPKKGDVIKITTDNIHQWEVFVAREGHKVEIGNGGVIQIDGTAQSNYKVERDYLWMMGDNRDDSEDSRFWGFAPVDNVVGNALFIHWSMYWPPSSGYGDGYDPDEDQHFHIRWGRIGNIIR